MFFVIAGNSIPINEKVGDVVRQQNSFTVNKLIPSCPDPASLSPYFETIDFGHKVRIEYDGSYQVLSWASNNPQTTTLDYDGGDWAYYHNNGYGYLEIQFTFLSGGTGCTSLHLVYY